MTTQYYVAISHETLSLLNQCTAEGADFIPQSTEITTNAEEDIVLVLDSETYWGIVTDANLRDLTIDKALAHQCRVYLGREVK